MDLVLVRIAHRPDHTLGAIYVNGSFNCFTLEDELRKVKVKGETCIPKGRYRIKLRTEGDMNERYRRRYRGHTGMIWLQDVPGFEFIYIHIGNSDDDTDGCILVGAMSNINGTIAGSRQAYEALNAEIVLAMGRGEQVWISIVDNPVEGKTPV